METATIAERARVTKELVDDSGANYDAIAKRAHACKSTVSRVLTNSYQGADTTKERVLAAAESVAAAARRDTARAETMSERNFSIADSPYITRGQLTMEAILHHTYDLRQFAMITGPSGAGKTHTINRFLATHEDVIISTVIEGMSVPDMLDELAVAAGKARLYSNRHTAHRLRQAAAALHDAGIKMVIFDEADHWADAYTNAFLKRLSVARQLWEMGFAVAIVGLDKLADKLEKVGDTYLKSRIGFKRRIKAPTQDELKSFWAFLGGSGNDATVQHLTRRSAHNGLLRIIRTVHTMSERVSVETAVNLLFPE